MTDKERREAMADTMGKISLTSHADLVDEIYRGVNAKHGAELALEQCSHRIAQLEVMRVHLVGKVYR
jgi:hypothetical protein